MRDEPSLGAILPQLPKFIITKQLTKKLEDYPDARNQPHVQVSEVDGRVSVQCQLLPRSQLLAGHPLLGPQ